MSAEEILARQGVEPEEPRGRHAGARGVSDGTDEERYLAEIAGRYTPVNWKEAWLNQPDEVDWLFGEFLERGTVNAMFAKPGTGKSLLALEIAVSIVKTGGTVVYIDDENRVVDLVERLQAFGCEPGELDRLVLYSFAQLPPLDRAPGGVHLTALAVTAGASLVILDTTTRMVEGRENDSDTFLQLYRCSLVPLKARNIAVLRLDHPGKDESRGQRGSTAKDGDVDNVWHLTEVTKGLEYRLDRDKSRALGHGPETFSLRRRFGPFRHEWGDTACPLNDLQIKIIGQLDALNVPITAGREAVRKILAQHGIKAGNEQVSAAIKARKLNPGIVRDRPDSANAKRTDETDIDQLDMFGNPAFVPVPDRSGTGRTARPAVPASPPLGGDSGQAAVPDCADCGTPHLRYGQGGRPCKEQDLASHYHETQGVA